MPKRIKKSRAPREWTPFKAHEIGTEIRMLCVKHGEASGKTFGLVPPPKVCERRPVVRERYNQGRSVMAVDGSGAAYLVTCNFRGIRSVHSTTWDDCRPIPADMSEGAVRLMLYEAAQADETFEAHMRQLQSTRDRAAALTARVNAIVDSIAKPIHNDDEVTK